MEAQSNIIPMQENHLMQAALSYAAIGWHVLPCWWIEHGKCACGNANCKSPGKHPLHHAVPWGQKGATTDAEMIRQWWTRFPKANLAVQLEMSGLCAIDIDPRNGGLETTEHIETLHGPLVSDLLQFSGGGGEHRVFQKPVSLYLPGKLGPGVDVKLNGYIMLEPSKHMSGRLYAWEASSDPRDGIMASPLPDWMRDLANKAAPSTDAGTPGVQRVIAVTEEQKAELVQALQQIPSDDRDMWVSVGMALQSTGDSQWAFDTWTTWSKTSAKFDPVDQIRVWRSFKARGLDGLTYRYIFSLAQPPKGAPVQAVQAAALPAEDAPDDTPVAPQGSGIAPELLPLPGLMGECMDWMLRTAQRPQPMLALAATISLFATALSQKVCSPTRLRTNLYMVSVAGTSAGKDHGRKCLERAMQAARIDDLVGGHDLASGAGLLARAHACPRTVFQLDEFGLMLQSIRSKNAGANLTSIIKNLMVLFSSADSVYRGAEYADQKARPRQDIEYPCINLHATTTPEQFYPALGSQDVTSGALNRLLILIAPDAIVPRQDAPFEDVLQELADWLQAVQSLQGPDMQGVTPGNPVLLHYDAQARKAVAEFSDWLDERTAKAIDPQITMLWGRAFEHAIKLALVHAVASHPNTAALLETARTGALQITGWSAAWGIAFAKHMLERMEVELTDRMADSDFGMLCKDVSRVIKKHGRAKGLTPSELGRYSPRYRGSMPHIRDAVHAVLQRDEEIVLVQFPPASNGKVRQAWVHVSCMQPEFHSYNKVEKKVDQ